MSASGDITARLVYYGPEGAGKTTNVQFIYNKLKKGHRGDLRVTQIPGKVTAQFEVLPVELGLLHGFKTSIYVHTVPGAAAHAEVRRRMLEKVDGIVFVADLRPSRHEATVASLGELRNHLATYGRKLEDIVLVVQYNRRDEADENAVERLHRLLAARPTASFEAVATTGTGVLQTLTAISKSIVQSLRSRAEGGASPEPAAPAAQAAPAAAQRSAPAAPAPRPRDAAAARAPTAPSATPKPSPAMPPSLAISGKDITIESVGPTDCTATDVRIPIRLVHSTAGRIELCLRLSLGNRTDD